MLPEEYQIDESTMRRMEEEAGEALPDGAVEALYEFEMKHPEFSEVIHRRMQPGPESVWMRATLLARMGVVSYLKFWEAEIAREIRLMESMLGIPPATEYRINGFHIRNLGPQPVDHDGEWSFENCWRITDDGADSATMDIYLDDDADVEKALRTVTGWVRQVQAEDEGESL